MHTFWNWHEPSEGKFDFAGDHDLNAFLKLVHQMGLYAICRVGPYYCAEWDGGGYPLWLRFKPGLSVREPNLVFENAVDKFFGQLMPIVAANQLNRGGSVILVQLENEGVGWGTDEPNAYFTHLRTEALRLGLEVPYFFSGLHHASDPAGDASLDDAYRPNPWFSTEFWSVWYDRYGSTDADAAVYSRRTWKIIAHGGGGYNYYMAHGGTNFAYTNNNKDAASYDYGAAVGQGGDLRPIYFAMKRAAWFARSFGEILENSADDTPAYARAGSNPSVRVTARTGPAGTIVFLDNPTGAVQTTLLTLPGAPGPERLTLAPHEIRPVVRSFALLPGVTLGRATARILGIVPQGDTTTLVVYGPAGSSGALTFSGPARKTQRFEIQFRPGNPSESAFTIGRKRVRILALTDTLADRTWFAQAGTQTQIVCGPAYVGDVSVSGTQITAERPWRGQNQRQSTDPRVTALVYGPSGPPRRLLGPAILPAHPRSLPLGVWRAKSAAAPAAASFGDRAWASSAQSVQMGADGDRSADAWYRTRIAVPHTGSYLLTANGGDRAAAFVDGRRVGGGSPRDGFQLALPSGAHTLAVFTAHDGRDKLFGYTGPLLMKDPKGLVGPVSIDAGSHTTLTRWRVLPAGGPAAALPAPATVGWKDYRIGDDPFGGRIGFAWLETVLPTTPAGSRTSLHFESVDDNGTVFVNGVKIGEHRGWDTGFDLPLPPGLSPGSRLSVLVENTGGRGGLGGPVRLSALSGPSVTATEWREHGGPGDPAASDGWGLMTTSRRFDGPAFFRTMFAAVPPAPVGPHPIWRVLTTGLGHGSVWVNGHNLGRYPEKVPVNGVYIPECWLLAGKNTLTVYDEDGERPDRVTIAAEAAASCDALLLTASIVTAQSRQREPKRHAFRFATLPLRHRFCGE